MHERKKFKITHLPRYYPSHGWWPAFVPFPP